MENIQDIPKLYTAFAEWLACMGTVYMCRSFLRKGVWPVVVIVSLPVLGAIQLFCGEVDGILWLLGMAAAFITMFFTVLSALLIEKREALYLTVRAFMIAEFAAALEWQLDYFLGLYTRFDTPLPSVIFCVVFYFAVISIHYYIEYLTIPQSMESSLRGVTTGQLALTYFVVTLIFILSNMSYVHIDLPFTGTTAHEIFNIRALMDLIGVTLLIGINLQRISQISFRENFAVQQMMQNQYNQYLAAEENRELINRKYHDLKHQLHILRSTSDSDERLRHIDEFAQGLSDYEGDFKTGNSVLDAILTEKGAVCRQKGIELIVSADGSVLNTLLTVDICAIFGNALDNAIEYEETLEPEKRRIRVEVSKKNSFTCILVENRFEGELRLSSTLPETTKAEKEYHGYGLKSIKYAAEKYGGVLKLQTEDSFFRVKVLIPEQN